MTPQLINIYILQTYQTPIFLFEPAATKEYQIFYYGNVLTQNSTLPNVNGQTSLCLNYIRQLKLLKAVKEDSD